ncbi:MAG: DEAD/DEAH box helicase family protein, partial [Chlorobiales bacterium]|nr:DEAD/DEAH box helicase family protein [Chlorobiales bacterium]
MENRRNFDVLKKFDYQFKKHGLTLWCGKEEVKSISFFKKGETVTFRCTEINPENQSNSGSNKVEFEHAGTVEIAESESGINLYEHQQTAFLKLQEKVIKSNKNPFAGLLVLPTGGGKTLTAAYWIAKNFLDKNKKVLWVAHRHELLDQAK